MEFEVRRRRGDGDATLLDRIREDERDEELASRASQGFVHIHCALISN